MMATNAITAINNYQQQSFFSAASPQVINTREASYAMFGVTGRKVLSYVSISSEGSAILDNVKSE